LSRGSLMGSRGSCTNGTPEPSGAAMRP